MNTTTQTAPAAPQTIDVTGLKAEQVMAVHNLIRAFRGQPMLAAPETSWVLYGPQPGETPEAWFQRFMGLCMIRDSGTWFVDDSRDSIYAGCGE